MDKNWYVNVVNFSQTLSTQSQMSPLQIIFSPPTEREDKQGEMEKKGKWAANYAQEFIKVIKKAMHV